MKVLSICGSYRKKGNTAALIETLESEIKKATIPDMKMKELSLSDLEMDPCHACLKCKKKGYCVVSDDFSKVSSQLLKSDVIILGSPVYFSDVSSQVKTLIDRTLSLWHTRQLKGKKVILAATCNATGTEHTIETLKNWANGHEMEVISTIEGKGEKRSDVLKDEKVIAAVKNSVEALQKMGTPEGT